MTQCICGNKIKKGLKTCGSKVCSNNLRASHHRGKKRPGHAALMKSYYESGRVDTWKHSRNTEINQTSFKITRLKNHQVEFNENDLVDIDSKYSKLLRDVQATESCKKNKILSVLTNKRYNSEIEFLESPLVTVTSDHVMQMGVEEVDLLGALCNSIKSTINLRKNPRMGSNKNHKSELLLNIAFNKSGKQQVYIRSSYEKNYIEFFEVNKIYWDYELFSIQTPTGRYLPDFIVYGDNTYMVEVKGYVADYAKYYNEKLIYAINYCKVHDMSFVYAPSERINSIDDLKFKILKGE